MVYFLYFALYNNKSNVVFTSSIEFDWHFIFWFGMLSIIFYDIIGLVLCFNATVDFYCKKIKYCIISSFIRFQMAVDYYSSFLMNPYGIQNEIVKAIFMLSFKLLGNTFMYLSFY